MDCFASLAMTGGAVIAALRHHQHVEHDDRRQRQDHRPDADGPQNVLGAKTLFRRNGVLVFEMHDAPPRFWCYGAIDTRRVLKTRLRFRLDLTAPATAD